MKKRLIFWIALLILLIAESWMWFAFSLETFTHMLVGAMIGIAVIGLIADIQKIGERSSDNDGETAEEPN